MIIKKIFCFIIFPQIFICINSIYFIYKQTDLFEFKMIGIIKKIINYFIHYLKYKYIPISCITIIFYHEFNLMLSTTRREDNFF